MKLRKMEPCVAGSCTESLKPPSHPELDNVDAEILAALRLNPHPTNYSVIDVIIKSSCVAMQLSASIVVVILYYHISCEYLQPIPVFLTTLLTSLIGYILFHVKCGTDVSTQFYQVLVSIPREHLEIAVVYLLFSYLLAPTLRTLTDTVSTDTIHVTAFLMFCLHLVTNDYGIKGFMVSKPISVNAAVIGSLFLASRLETDWQSIALLTFGVQSFILFPIFARMIRESSVVLVVIIILSASACYTVSANVFLGYAILMFLVVIVSPSAFVISSGFKKNIYGPWDEAIPVIKAKEH